MRSLIILAALVAAVSCFSIPSERQLHSHWQSFKAQHGRQYATAAEENLRMRIFKKNAIKVAVHNDRFDRGEVTFKMAVNKFTDMEAHEVAERYNGYRSGMKPKSGLVHNVSAPALGFLGRPSTKSVDWRSKGYVTPVKDQGSCGSCWSFSATGALEGALFKKTGKLVSLSEQNLVDCSRRYDNEGCDGGLMDYAFQYVKDNGGIDTESSYPYEGVDARCRYSKDNVGGQATGYVDIPSRSEKSLKDAVSKVGPVSVAIDASLDSFNAYDSGIYYDAKCSSVSLDHGVLVVGFGSDGKNKDYWIVKNSWGPEWGEKGYIRIARNKRNHCGVATEASYPTV